MTNVVEFFEKQDNIKIMSDFLNDLNDDRLEDIIFYLNNYDTIDTGNIFRIAIDCLRLINKNKQHCDKDCRFFIKNFGVEFIYKINNLNNKLKDETKDINAIIWIVIRLFGLCHKLLCNWRARFSGDSDDSLLSSINELIEKINKISYAKFSDIEYDEVKAKEILNEIDRQKSQLKDMAKAGFDDIDKIMKNIAAKKIHSIL